MGRPHSLPHCLPHNQRHLCFQGVGIFFPHPISLSLAINVVVLAMFYDLLFFRISCLTCFFYWLKNSSFSEFIRPSTKVGKACFLHICADSKKFMRSSLFFSCIFSNFIFLCGAQTPPKNVICRRVLRALHLANGHCFSSAPSISTCCPYFIISSCHHPTLRFFLMRFDIFVIFLTHLPSPPEAYAFTASLPQLPPFLLSSPILPG